MAIQNDDVSRLAALSGMPASLWLTIAAVLVALVIYCCWILRVFESDEPVKRTQAQKRPAADQSDRRYDY